MYYYFFVHLITIFNFGFIPQDVASTLKALPAVDVVQGLDIEGELIAAFRGKELVFAIDKVSYSYFYTIVMLTFSFLSSYFVFAIRSKATLFGFQQQCMTQ